MKTTLLYHQTILTELKKIIINGSLLLAILFLPVLTTSSFGQTKPEVLTNQTVISLVKAGLDKSVIITTINNSDGKFDVNATSLINLRKQGVSNEIISAMVDRSAGKPNKPSDNPKAEVKIVKKGPKIDLINHPYTFNSATNVANPLEKNVAEVRTKTKAFGYGGVTHQYEVSNVKSATRQNSADSVYFLINTGGVAIPEFVLYQTKIEKDKRVAATFTAKPIGGAKSGNNTISYNTLPAGNGLFKLVPSQKLEKGEYFFAGKPVGSANSLDVYSFGID
ncbi:hypothetical protein [Dyadobacter sp. NIV53]|uniref:hypothetical protein n=1 Tax=Dyadobacter sp. NIV53 TaxID=2861765 RepID=UPI001C87F233|nr:hypothetical protein [Dyadobacter sp. NIV53]